MGPPTDRQEHMTRILRLARGLAVASVALLLIVGAAFAHDAASQPTSAGTTIESAVNVDDGAQGDAEEQAGNQDDGQQGD